MVHKLQKTVYVRLFLPGGSTIEVHCQEDEYDGIYDKFFDRSGVMLFENGAFHADQVAGMEYLEAKERQ